MTAQVLLEDRVAVEGRDQLRIELERTLEGAVGRGPVPVVVVADVPERSPALGQGVVDLEGALGVLLCLGEDERRRQNGEVAQPDVDLGDADVGLGEGLVLAQRGGECFESGLVALGSGFRGVVQPLEVEVVAGHAGDAGGSDHRLVPVTSLTRSARAMSPEIRS